MFLPILAAQIRALLSPRATRVSVVPPIPTPVPAETIAAGTRYQLLRALNALAEGQSMLVAHRLPELPASLDEASRRCEIFRALRDAESWQDRNEIEPVLVPGTAFPGVVGRILISAGWCAPSEHPHWVPNLRIYFLTRRGYESLLCARSWWAELSMLQRLRLMVME